MTRVDATEDSIYLGFSQAEARALLWALRFTRTAANLLDSSSNENRKHIEAVTERLFALRGKKAI